MPVIGRGDDDGIDVRPVEHRAKIPLQARRPRNELRGRLQDARIDIAQRRDLHLPELEERPQKLAAPVAHPDEAHPQPVGRIH